MKFGVLLIISSLHFIHATAQVFSSDCTPSGTMQDIYRNDALKLAITRLNQTQTNWKDSVDIPAVYTDSIAKALYAIHNMTPGALKDTIMDIFGFSNFNGSGSIGISTLDSLHGRTDFGRLKQIMVLVYNTAAWAPAWAAGNYTATGTAAIDYLVNRYGLTIVQTMIGFYSDKKMYELSAPKGINSPALVKLFSPANIPGVAYSQPGYTIGDGNYMLAEFNANGIKLTYRNGCGDCPVGCTISTRWEFQVYTNTDCHVEFLGRTPPGDSNNFPHEPQQVCLLYTGILPLQFVRLTGTIKNNSSVLEWETTGEENISHYIIERSLNGTDFNTAGRLNAMHYSSGNKYQWNEPSYPGIVYYRVIAAKQDGAFVYSSVKALKSSNYESGLSLYPNPVSNREFSILLPGARGNYTIKLLSAQGTPVFEKSVSFLTNQTLLPVNLPATLPAGLYYFVMENQQDRFSQLLQVK